MYLPQGSGRLVNPGAPQQPMMPKPGMMNDSGMAPQPMLPKPGMMNDGGMRPSLGGLVQQHPGRLRQEEFGLQGQGGLMRLLNMYGRPQGGGFHRGAY